MLIVSTSLRARHAAALALCLGLAAAVPGAAFAADKGEAAAKPAAASAKAAEQPLTDAQANAVVQILDAVLAQRPQLVVDSLIREREIQNRERAQQFDLALRVLSDESALDGNRFAFGSPEATRAAVLFETMNCPLCRTLSAELKERSGDAFRFMVRTLPNESAGGPAPVRALIAADAQGKWSDLREAMQGLGANLAETDIMTAAAKAKLDLEKLKADMKSSQTSLTANRALQAASLMRVRIAPTVLIDGRLLEQPTLEELKQALDNPPPAPTGATATPAKATGKK